MPITFISSTIVHADAISQDLKELNIYIYILIIKDNKMHYFSNLF